MMRMALIAICGWRVIKSKISASLQLTSTVFSQSGGVRRVAAIREQSDRAEQLAWADEADDHLGAVAARLGDAHASLDDGVSANVFIALVEYPGSGLHASRARGAGHDFQNRKRQPQKQISGGKALWRYAQAGFVQAIGHWPTLADRDEDGHKFAPAQTLSPASWLR